MFAWYSNLPKDDLDLPNFLCLHIYAFRKYVCIRYTVIKAYIRYTVIQVCQNSISYIGIYKVSLYLIHLESGLPKLCICIQKVFDIYACRKYACIRYTVIQVCLNCFFMSFCAVLFPTRCLG